MFTKLFNRGLKFPGKNLREAFAQFIKQGSAALPHSMNYPALKGGVLHPRFPIKPAFF
jgi:hypothetical protein